ncbi:hypothetical protein V2H45_13195 [Tumidithrix elongata RA019]|uniref:Uncharacterized protein n=1 Tax=Tumidithrix elongata BACA0141 TaxID=2716417 RepID=A0AAW9Q386_9CYAN|nr:hypothetical protein [Tumidithrix elongata RA019]
MNLTITPRSRYGSKSIVTWFYRHYLRTHGEVSHESANSEWQRSLPAG